MSVKTEVTEFKSDLTGKAADGTVTSFEYEGVTVSLHLTDSERANLDKTLRKYIAKAHDVQVDPAVLREYARSQGLAVGERGRISAEIRNAFLGLTPEAGSTETAEAEPVAAE